MAVHLYFSLIPEALIASNLPPEKFGQYYATGAKYKSKGQSIFFEIDPTFRHPYFEIDTVYARCVPAADGTPKHSVYVAVYRVLEHLPLSAIGRLYLTTAYGHTIGLDRADRMPEPKGGLHMYQDLAPVNSLVVSRQDPATYYEGITSKPAKFIRFPGMCFVELELGALAKDPENGAGRRPAVLVHAPPARGAADPRAQRQGEQAGAPRAFARVPVPDGQGRVLHGQRHGPRVLPDAHARRAAPRPQ